MEEDSGGMEGRLGKAVGQGSEHLCLPPPFLTHTLPGAGVLP